MNELTIAGKKYISSNRAAEVTGYAKDYVGQLCREGYVVATKVGRSWYALESSIMEHRFGKVEKEDIDVSGVAEQAVQEKVVPIVEEVEKVMEEPIYTREEIVPIPVIKKETVNTINLVSDAQEPSETIVDMQGAWQEWFSKKQEALIESPEVIEERYEDLKNEALLMPVVQPEHSQEITSLREEPVSIRREFDAVRPVVASVEPVEDDSMQDVITIHRLPLTALKEQTPNTLKIKTKTANNGGQSNLVTRALLISVAIVIVAIAVIGSGLADKYLSSSIIQGNPAIKLIQGKSDLNK